MRIGRAWRRWSIGAVVVLAAATAVTLPAIADSDWYTLHYTSLKNAPAAVPDGRLPTHVRSRWSDAGLLLGNDKPATAATIVTAQHNEISGRNPTTGAVRWNYRRGNTTLCDWTMDQTGNQPTAIAVFRNGSSCSDITGFDADTGKRRWYLNADLPADIKLLDGGGMYFALSSSSVTGFYGDGGAKAWTYDKRGCTFPAGTAGDVGLVLIASCSGRTDLVLLDGYTGKQRWDMLAPGARPHVLSADSNIVVFSDVAGQNQLAVFSADGRVAGTINDTKRFDYGTLPISPPTVVGQRWIGYDGNRVFAVDLHHPKVLWSINTIGPAVVHDNHVLVPTRHGFATYDLNGKRLSSTTASSMLPSLQGIAAIGNLVIGRNDTTTVVYG